MNWYKLLLAECNSSLKCATTHPRLVEKIIELYTKKKLSTPQISTLIGLGVGTIRSILKRRGVLRTWEQATGNKIIPMTSALEAKIMSLYHRGFKRKEIAEKLGLPIIKVVRVLTRNGIGWPIQTPEQLKGMYDKRRMVKQRIQTPLGEMGSGYKNIYQRPGKVWLPDIENMDSVNHIIQLYKPIELGGYGMKVVQIAALYHTTERTIKNILIKNKAFFSTRSRQHNNTMYYSQPLSTDKRSPEDYAPKISHQNPLYAKIMHMIKNA